MTRSDRDQFDPSDPKQVELALQQFLKDEPASSVELEAWLLSLSGVMETIDEHGSRVYIDSACHTDDPAKEEAYLHFVRHIQPVIEPVFFEIQKKFLASPHRAGLTDPAIELLVRQWKADVDLFRPENIPIEIELAELSKDYGKLCGAMMVEYRGKSHTLQQMAVYLEETDRATREEAWRLVSGRRLKDREAFDAIFDKQLEKRGQVARNAGHSDYRSYVWLSRKRFDYTPQDCLTFAEGVEAGVMPLIRKLDEQRARTMKLEKLRPWDGSVDALGRPPLRPFEAADIDSFVRKTQKLFGAYCPAFAEQFGSMIEKGELDLASRPGKRPGGFQSSLEKRRRPFIFMNAAGLQADVETLLHEGGHAFHYLASCNIEPMFLRHAPLEFCEVASMSQELIGCEHYSLLYADSGQAARARRKQLEGAVRVLPWVATIDGFQHWLYTHPGHSRAERQSAWLNILNRFSSSCTDWSGLEDAREAMWQRQVHLFSYPFYYIEYGIAQLGALRLWLNYRREGAAALDRLRGAFALGGQEKLPGLFEASGIPFDFGPAAVRELAGAVAEALDALPE